MRATSLHTQQQQPRTSSVLMCGVFYKKILRMVQGLSFLYYLCSHISIVSAIKQNDV
jgi:hypothetical protein